MQLKNQIGKEQIGIKLLIIFRKLINRIKILKIFNSLAFTTLKLKF